MNWHKYECIYSVKFTFFQQQLNIYVPVTTLSLLLMIYVSSMWILSYCQLVVVTLTHWGRVTHICVVKLTIIGSDNGLSPGRRQALIWTNAGILLIGPLGTHFSEILIGIQTFSFKKMHFKMSSAKWRPFFLGLNVLRPLYDSFGQLCVPKEWLL